MSRRVGVEDDHIVEVGRHLFQALDNLVDNLDEPPGRSAAALGHGYPRIEARGGAKRREGNGILARGKLMERRTRSNRENT